MECPNSSRYLEGVLGDRGVIQTNEEPCEDQIFVGTFENALSIQIWIAMIAMLLFKYLKKKTQYNWHLSNLIMLIRLNLFVKIELMKWLNNPFYGPIRAPGKR